MRIVTIIGARPQFIKAAAVSLQIEKSDETEEVLVHTGQHFDSNMSDVFFEELGIPAPKYNLGISGGGHGEMTGRMLEAIEKVLVTERPDCVLVYGDTNSTLAGSIAAAKLNIPIAHVEAGLRSHNRRMPEEVNRVLTDHCSDVLFTPTQTATDTLISEGVSTDLIVQSGDVMYDAALHFGQSVSGTQINETTARAMQDGYILATIHRQENTDDPQRLEAIIKGLAQVAEETSVLLPLHPRTKDRIQSFGFSELMGKIQVIAPLSYLEMVHLEKNAKLIVTDSGGVQKEAFFFEVPCVTLRDETEWTELVTSGWNRLTPPLSQGIVADAITQSIGTRGKPITPYGQGSAAKIIVDTLRQRFGDKKHKALL